MKSTRQQIASSIKREILKAKGGHFVCTKCLKEKTLANKATQGNVCKSCRAAEKRAEYAVKGVPMECVKCHEVSTNFTGVNKICRSCRNKDKKESYKAFGKNLGEKLVLLWKAGYSFDEAINNVRFAKNFNKNYSRP